jgi:hypothetical protein
LYHIDGENGTISPLFRVNTFVVSSDGRFVAFMPDSGTIMNTVGLFSVEERDVIAQFEVTIDRRISLRIAQEGISNFRIFNIDDDWPYSNAEGILDTENLTLQMNEISGRFPFEHNEIAGGPVMLNQFPRLRHTLNIALPLPNPGTRFGASELVNVHSAPDFSSEVIQSVGRRISREDSYSFRLYEIGEEAVFDGITSHWAYVRLWGAGQRDVWETDTSGWVFLGLMTY